MKKPKPPKILDAMVAVVLAYRPKPKSKPARKRKRQAAKIAKAIRNKEKRDSHSLPTTNLTE
jgi:hypothetical protein